MVRALIVDIRRHGTPWGRKFAFHREFRLIGYDEEDNAVYSTTDTEWALRAGGPNGAPMRVLSGSEAAHLLIEFAAALGRERAKTAPTVVLLDGSAWPFDDTSMDMIGEYLSKQPFQTVLTAVGGWNPRDKGCWKEWKRFELQGPRGDAKIVPIDW